MHDNRDAGDWDDPRDDSAALDFSPDFDDTPGSLLDAFDVFIADQADSGDHDQLHTDEDGEADLPLVNAMNPPGTVTVSAYLTGNIQSIELTPDVTALTERELAEEILVVAEVATKRATATMHVLSVELFTAQGVEREVAETFMRDNTPYATPADAIAAEATLVARHAHRDD